MSEPTLLTVPEAAVVLRGSDGREECDFVRGLILDGRISAIKQRGRWYVQRQSLEALGTPRLAGRPPSSPPRRVAVRRRVATP